MTDFGHNINHRVFIKAPPEKVYDTISSAEGWNAFFTTGLEVDPVAGGKMIWRWKDWGPDFYTAEAAGQVVKAERPNVFSFQWTPVKDNPTTIEFRLTSRYSGTVIEVTESGYPDSTEGRAMILECACGWGEALALLKFYLEHRIVYTQPNKDN